MTTGYAPSIRAAFPFTLAGNHIYLTARVGRSRPLSLVFETGAGMTALDRAAASELGVRGSAALPAQGAGGDTVSLELGRIPGLALGDVSLPGMDVALHDFAGLHRHTGRRFDGLLAHASLRAFVVEIDFPARTLRLHDSAGFAYRGSGVTLPYHLDLGLIHVPATLAAFGGAAVTADLVLDTRAGGRAAAVLSSPFCRDRGWPVAGAPSLHLDAAGHGLAGAAIGSIGRLDRLGLGPLELEQPIVLFSGDTKGFLSWPGRAGVLGVEALRRGRVFIDDARQLVILEPTASWSTPFEYDASGMLLECEGEALDRVRVRAVLESSPAHAAGVRAGDHVLAVNGQAARAIPLHRLRDLLARDGRRYLLSIERGRLVREIEIETHRLI